MRKNYFAKKFVAYSMAFAVAFSTLTVSPVFVKEAKAAGAITINDGVDAGDPVVQGKFYQPTGTDTYNGAIIVGPVYSKISTSGKAMSLDDFKTFASFAEEKVAGSITNANVVSLQDASDSNAIVHTLGVAFNGKDRTDAVNGDTDYGNVNVTYVSKNGATPTAGNIINCDWYKLTPRTKVIDYSENGTDEKITVPYYVLEKTAVTKTATNDTLVFPEVNADQVGTYIGLSGNKLMDTVVVKEVSDMNAVVSQKTIYSVVGKKATLAIDATATRNITYSWTRNGKELGTDASLTVDVATKSDFGTYSCKVSDGLKTETLSVNLLETKNVTNKADATGIVSYKKVLTDGDIPTNSTINVETSIPASDELVYLWTVGNTDGKINTFLSNNFKANYNASNRSITLKTLPTDSVVNVYAVDKKEYENYKYSTTTDIADKLDKIAEAQSFDVLTAVDNLLDDEFDALITNTPDTLTPLFTETITLVNTNDKNTSETKVLKLGDSLKLSVPTVDGVKTTTKYTWTGANVTNLGSYSTTTKNVSAKELNFNTLGINDFGTYTCNIDIEGDSTDAEPDGIMDGSASDDVKYVVNVVYVSDFTASAVEIVSAKIGAKDVKFTVDAKSTLPISYTWNKSINTTYYDDVDDDDNQGTSEPTIDPTQAWKEANITAGVATTQNIISIAEITNDNKEQIYTTLNAKGKVDLSETTKALDPTDDSVLAQQPKYNYYTCLVSDGISQKTFTFGVKAATGFTVDKANDVTLLSALKDSTVTLTPVVKLGESKEITYEWTKGAKGASTNVLSTEASYSFEYDGTANTKYTVKITDGVQTEYVTFTVDPLKTVSNTNIKNYKAIASNAIYNGKEITGNIVVKGLADGTNMYTLVEGKDYTVKYENNINVGVARYTVSFIGLFEGVKDTTDPRINTITGTFAIDRADNEVTVADKTVVLGESVQPKTTNKAGAAVTYTYYTDEACTTALEAAPTKVGTYYVKATSIATANYNEATSNVATVKVVPGKVKMLGTSRTASSVKLNWNKTTGATSYRVYYKAAGAKSYKVFKNTTATSMNVTGLASATTYTFAVKAYAKTAGYSTVYATKKTTTAPAKVAKPTVTAGSKKATVKFTKVARATGYQVYMAKGNGSYKKVATTKSLSFTKTGLAKGATYKFKVRAYKTVGSNTYYGAFSSAKAVVVK